jgi:hypothetical protein
MICSVAGWRGFERLVPFIQSSLMTMDGRSWNDSEGVDTGDLLRLLFSCFLRG